MKNLSLKYKLFFILSVLILFYAVCSVLFVNFYLKNELKRHLIDIGKMLTATVSSHIANDLLIKDFVEVDAFFEDTMKNNPEVSYIFVEKDGQVLLHTFHEGFPGGLLGIEHKKGAIDYVLIESDGEVYYDFSAQVFGGLHTLRLGISGKMIDKMLNNIIRFLLYVTVSAVFIALVFSMFVSQRLIRPLSMLTSSAVKIADGDYSKTVPPYGEDEVGKLSSAFNKMIAAVKTREKELREINDELEIVNIKLHDYIEELNRTKNELIKSKQDKAVLETSRALIHHVRQPLTYLLLAIQMLIDEIQSDTLNIAAIRNKLEAIDAAGKKMARLLDKFERLNEYKFVEYSDKTKIIDIGE